MADDRTAQHAPRRPDKGSSLKSFLGGADEGMQAVEYLLIIATIVVSCMAAILLLEDVIREYLGFETVIITSPFF
ncbi:MAG: hypothetical protein GY856_32450 [bacterium]|nr:hypothetical protein [bacterium]